MTRANADIIRAGALWGYCPLTRLLGQDPHPLLAEVGLSESDLDDPNRFVSRPSAAALLELSAARLGHADLGLDLAAMQGVYVLGPVAFAVRNAPDRRGAIATIVKYVHYRSPLATMTIEHNDVAHEERIVFNHPDARSGPQLTELALGLFCRIDRHLTGNRYRATRVTFTHSPLSSPDVYLKHFRVAPEFNAPGYSVCVDQRELSVPLTTAIPQLQEIIEDYLERHAPAPGLDVDRRAREAVAQMISSDGNATVDDISSMLRMRARTLQRRLEQEGTTVGKVRDGVRRRMAEIYLTDDRVPLAHVPYLLGYADQSALTRNCARWFGTTPPAIREHAPHADLHPADQ